MVLLTALAALLGAGAIIVRHGEAGDSNAPVLPEAGSPDEKQELDLSATSRPAPTVHVPASGPGTFRTAEGTGDPVGAGTVLRYRVQVEDGLELDAEDAAAEVHGILGHPRGWTNDGETGFELVSSGEVDFSVKIATPGTVDDICGEYGLDTRGEVNCRVGDNVVVNLLRWVEGSPRFPGPIEDYRALIINHEVGHRLGHGHLGCPGDGEPAPAMMQQIKGLEGCEANAWPYDEAGDYLDGPWRE
ncbi:DUF3152 domain-containing protein [Streptomyces sp. ACA25]|uniref:DUF3152 domain-containing protein n=1 Tax=Streptomyces sp. ACA25 TaxID=3022596 RepID=UPI002307492D|nr:DUF3152 domain-containing protein [Streptomyces sp. ACA25]MDB1090243.1 DUF3152 domain-containing protein [Streptomyces sp. ACA25]